ncbi:multidrug DMT transporter permease [Mucilaginibacter conchicola]|uniref:Multidrug DMT transporter permease n=1 Tax=Mucilaginibacter conchicola TaxID=2303333 RepID=A0A372NUZ5_9SPHI|nr:GRP family sugar transporter [Mucilaginibacter conchicola]RFZ93988.1 multidrug DMT transporter permease [Mucilaginibacter conchicola]
MFIIENYSLAVIFCVITMFCWGSWANTQKLAQGKWAYEFFYWDYVLGIVLFSVVAALTLGSNGSTGRGFLDDIQQVDSANLISAFVGGIIFNLANILLTIAIAIAGMSVAFPVGIGIALILGVIANFFLLQKGDPVLLFVGVIMVTLAIILNAVAYGSKKTDSNLKTGAKGIIVAVIAGVLMSQFYKFVASGMDLENFVEPAAGKMTPYTASVVFSIGILASNFILNTIMMKRPIEGVQLSYAGYFKGRFKLHLIGLLGGCIWALGNLFNLIAAGKAGPAVSYGLGQGATLIAAIWGVAVWKEFKNSPPKIIGLLAGMFLFFIAGLGLIIIAGGS